MPCIALPARLDTLALAASLLCVLSLWPLKAEAEARGKVKRAAVSEIEARGSAREQNQAEKADGALQKAEAALARGELSQAIQAFLQADREERNMATLVRAFEAATELDDALLIVQVAERILSRSEVSDEGRTLARKAVARASDRLTQLELVCAERPCSFSVDGLEASEGISYWNPGAHEVRLAERAEPPAHVTCAARAICRLTLPVAEAAPARALVAAVPLRAGGLAQSSQPLESDKARGPRRVEARGAAREQNGAAQKTPSRGPVAFLVSSSVAAAALVGLATWTGARAVQARSLHGSDEPQAYDADHVRTLARRTDYLFLGAALSAGAAAATAIWWVDWDARRRTSLSLDGATSLKATHRF